MSKNVSPWVMKVVRIYIILVVVGTFLGVLSGGLGGIFVIPLLLPWIAIVPIIELKTGLALLDSIWAGPLIAMVSGTINGSLLFLILRFVDGRRRRKQDDRPEETQ